MSIGGTYDLPLPLICVIKVRMRDFLMAILSSEWPSFIVILVMRFCNWCNLWNHLPLSFFLLLMMMIFFWLDIASGNRFVGCKLFKKSRIKNDITPNEQKKRGMVTAKFPRPFWDSLFCLDRRRNLQTSF